MLCLRHKSLNAQICDALLSGCDVGVALCVPILSLRLRLTLADTQRKPAM